MTVVCMDNFKKYCKKYCDTDFFDWLEIHDFPWDHSFTSQYSHLLQIDASHSQIDIWVSLYSDMYIIHIRELYIIMEEYDYEIPNFSAHSKRSRTWRRFQRFRHINRKHRIAKRFLGHGWYPQLGYYHKGKIHCSCGMCRIKTGTHGNPHRDRRKLAQSLIDDTMDLKE